MLRAHLKLVTALLLVNASVSAVAEQTLPQSDQSTESSNSTNIPIATAIFELRTAAPIFNISGQYDFRDYPMPTCEGTTPLCGPLGQGIPTRLFIAVPANNTVVSSYIQTWVGGYWSLSLNKGFTLLNIGMDW